MKEQTTSTETLLTERQAADMLGVSQRFLSNRRCRRQPPDFVRIGRLVRYRLSALEMFLAENTVTVPGADDSEA